MTVKRPARLTFFALSVLTALLFLSGCQSTGLQNYSDYAPDESNRLIIYTSHMDDVYIPLVREFEERTGIWVQVVTGSTRELLDRIASGKDELPCDLVFGGGVESLSASAELFIPYESSLLDSVQEDCLSQDGSWTALSRLPVVLIYNSKLVRANPPSSWDDLLDDAWRGEIAFADPNFSSFAYTALVTLLTALSPEAPEDVMQLFAENLAGTMFPLADDVIEQVSNGNFYIGVALEDDALRGIRDGYDIAVVYPSEGTSIVPDGMAIVAGCAHEENARLFIDFALGEDAQNFLTDQCLRRSVRTDVPASDSLMPPVSVLPYDIGQAAEQLPSLLEQWNRIVQEVSP